MQFCRMELLQLIFKLGVVFAIFSFIWGFFELIAKFMTNGRSKTIVEIYVIKALKYLFLVDVTFLFSLNKTQEIIDLNNLIPTILVVLVYFIGKLQNKQNNAVIFQLMQQQNPVLRLNYRRLKITRQHTQIRIPVFKKQTVDYVDFSLSAGVISLIRLKHGKILPPCCPTSP